ncbi:hypothetical protein [Actinacidiphila alni]|uniref:hypothetical protein n=1 Tax=Actinacidiphila alni TaxID=380248 RepID=UPI003453F025
MRGPRTPIRTARRGGRSVVGRATAALALAFAAVCGGLTLGAVPVAATPQPMSACTTTKGVVLAVDFSRWGGPLLRSCGTTPTTGYTLLNQGGWATTGTQHDGPAFICRIGYAGYQNGKQYPTSKDEACVLTPPATAYWSYWHADPGKNTWSYSQLGAMSYHPKPGSVDLWIFGATNIAGTQGRPTFSPDSVRAHNTSSGGTTTPPAKKGATTGGSGTHTTAPPAKPTHRTANTPTATAGTKSAGPSPTATTPSASTSSAAAPATPGTASPTGPRTQDAEPTAAAGHSSGSVLPVAITAAVVAVIAVAAALRVRRRRNAGHAP